MPATTIPRRPLPGLPGSRSDETIVNAVYDQIDSLFTARTIVFEEQTNGVSSLTKVNRDTGSSAVTRFVLGTLAGDLASLALGGPSHTTIPNTCELLNTGDGGIAINASHRRGRVVISTSGAERVRVSSSGHVIVQSPAQDLSPSDLVANASIAVYSKNQTFIIAYKNASTVTYLTIPLDGVTTTWTQTTIAP